VYKTWLTDDTQSTVGVNLLIELLDDRFRDYTIDLIVHFELSSNTSAIKDGGLIAADKMKVSSFMLAHYVREY
jgi:hypothetical protein